MWQLVSIGDITDNLSNGATRRTKPAKNRSHKMVYAYMSDEKRTCAPKPRDLIVHSFYPYQLSNADNFGDCKNCMMSLSKLRNAIYALCSWSDKSCLYHFCTTVFEVNLKPSHVRTTHMLHVTLSSSRKAVAFCQHAQRNAFRRRDARPQSRWFAPRNPKLPPSPNSIPPC